MPNTTSVGASDRTTRNDPPASPVGPEGTPRSSEKDANVSPARKWRTRTPSVRTQLGDTTFTAPKKIEEDEKAIVDKLERETIRGMIEKKSFINLVRALNPVANVPRSNISRFSQVQAFSVAIKHSLRGEHGPFYSDLYSLISFLPK